MTRKLNAKTSATKTKCAILLSLMICLSCLAGCRNADDAESSEDNFIVQPVVVPNSDAQTIPSNEQTIVSESNPADNETGDSDMVNEGASSGESGHNKYTIEGFDFVDGMEMPVCVTLSVESIQRGEEAYEKLQVYHSDITPPNENEEYIIATFNVP